MLVTALVGAAALPGDRAWKKPIAGVLAALLYLMAAYYAEGAFKELLMGMFLLAIVLQAERLRVDWRRAPPVAGSGSCRSPSCAPPRSTRTAMWRWPGSV